MKQYDSFKPAKLSVVIPCFNEAQTLAALAIQDTALSLEVIVVDDGSTDRSTAIAEDLAHQYPEVRLLRHRKNQGKGAALRTGFHEATGDFVAVQDADLEYEPMELKELLGPLRSGRADVVFGSRFLGASPHRVLYFWHYLGNLFLTFLSNMFTDLNLSDMETCYKVFRREVIQSIEIREDRFGFEPEVTAKIAQQRLRIYEMGISYAGRTYAEGKKIAWRDGVRALYCIFRYNAYQLPLAMQFLIYLFIGGTAALINLAAFLLLMAAGVTLTVSAPISFVVAAFSSTGRLAGTPHSRLSSMAGWWSSAAPSTWGSRACSTEPACPRGSRNRSPHWSDSFSISSGDGSGCFRKRGRDSAPRGRRLGNDGRASRPGTRLPAISAASSRRPG